MIANIETREQQPFSNIEHCDMEFVLMYLGVTPHKCKVQMTWLETLVETLVI